MIDFPANAYLVAFITAWWSSFLTLPLWRRWCHRWGLMDDPGHRKIHHASIPLAGGLACLSGMIVPTLLGASSLLWFPWNPETVHLLQYGFAHRLPHLAVLYAGGVGMLVLGSLDDRYELPPALKFAGQITIAALVALVGVRITLFIEHPTFSFVITIVWILTLTNAFNFLDNMNGLCAGLGAIAATALALTAGLQGQYLVTLFALLIAGALTGFLPYNFPSARAFLGDAGSHLVGYSIAILAILTTFYTEQHANPWAVVSPLLILAVPLADLCWVVCHRSWKGKPFYVGDTNHLSHCLVRLGLSPAQAVVLLWTAGASGAALSFVF